MKIFCIGRNYAEHAKELGNDVPDEPVVFIKPKSALLLPSMPFYYPEFTNELHYEVELVVRTVNISLPSMLPNTITPLR
jgi:2-keto-4-pentenoate hydratase/2-oxohepta-3-ene-1,7-dioic acid hydratase in catechol pathway